ncbi:MAG: hypothetical protein HOB52_03770, partial [Euryarchaeota archaeon]|nr:hypothetical protein [Euryarchaeota archaeon]
WLGKWYSPSIELMPEKYRSAVKDKILCYIPAMDSEDENKLTSWDMNAIIESDTVAQQSETLANEMRAALKPR